MRLCCTTLMWIGLCLAAISVGSIAQQCSAVDIGEDSFAAALPAKLCVGGAACPDGEDFATPCLFPGRNCKTSESCLCDKTGNDVPKKLCDCFK
jgi:hypothetical protein